MALTSTVKTDLYRFFAVAFDAAPGVTYMNQLAEAVNSGMTIPQIVEVFTTKTQFTSVYPTFFTNQQFATKLVNTVVGDSATSAAKAEAAADIVAALALGGEWTRGKVIYTIFNNLANKDAADATWGNTAKQMANQVAYAQYYTEEMLADSTDMATLRAVISNVTQTSSTDAAAIAAALTPAAAAQTFTLTTGTDNIPGGAGNDTITAVLQAAGATGTTVAPGDVVNGGAGTDTLSIAVAGALGADYTLSAIQTRGVEKVLLNNFDTAASNNIVDTALMTGLTTVGLSASDAAGDTIFTGLNGLVGAEIRNGAGDLTLTYNAAVVAGAADTQAVTVSNLSAGTFTADGAETIAITSELAKSTLTNVASNALKTITVAGAADLTISTALTTATINAAAATGAVSVKLGSATQTVTTGSGNDTIDAAGNLSNADTINAGTGTDTLKLSVGNATVAVGTSASKGDLFNVSGVEIIDVASTNDNATLNLDTTSGVTTAVAAANVKTVDFTASTVGNAAVTFVLNGVTVTTAATGGTTAATAATAVANAINLISGFTAVAATAVVTITATSGEAVEVATFGGAISGTAPTVSAYSDVSFTNVTTQAIDVYSADAVTASLKDASGSADVLAVNLKTLSADKGFDQAIGTITANNIETINLGVTGMTDGKIKTVAALTGNAVKTLNITGDSDLTISAFTSSTALTTIDGSTASGDLNLSAAPAAKDQSIKTGSGNDTINMGAFLTAADTIDGGANNVPAGGTSVGNDKVTATGNIGTVTTAAALKITNVETIEVATGGAAATYIDATGIVGAKSMGFSATSGTVKVTNLAAGVSIGLGETTNRFEGTMDVSLADATGAADSISFTTPSFDSATTIALTVASAVETVNIAATTNSANARTATFTNTNNAAKNIVVTAGHSADTVALGTLNAATTNVDGSVFAGILTGTTAATGAVTLSAKGGLGHNLVAGAGADTITLVGANGTAAPTLNGNAGTDVLNINLDNAASDFTNVSNIETINITVSGNKQAGFDDGTKDNGLNSAKTVNILGGDSLSTFTIGTAGVIDAQTAAYTFDASSFGGTTDVTVAAAGLNSFLTIKGGVSTKDVVRTTVNTTATKVASMTGFETLVLASTDSATGAAYDLANAVGLTALEASFTTAGAADTISVSNLASGVSIKATGTNAADNLIVALASATGTTDTLALELAGTTRLNFDAAGVETLNVKMSANSSILLDGVTATTGSTTTVNISGTGTVTLNGLSSSINTVASTGTGALTIAAADRTASAMTITGGEGGDSIAMRNSSDVLTGGLGTDTLVVSQTAILGGIEVNLGATDQVVSLNGSSNAAVQTGFESVDLSAFSGFGAVVTGSTGANTIVGTALLDQITSGNGADTITGGAGADVIDLTETTAASDTIVFSAAASNGSDTITGFLKGSTSGDVLNVAGLATLVGSGTAGGTAATNLVHVGAVSTGKTNTAVSKVSVIGATDNAAADWNNVVAKMEGALTIAADTTAGNATTVVLISNGTDTRVYLFADDATSNATIEAGEVTLVATLTGVVTASFAEANFALS